MALKFRAIPPVCLMFSIIKLLFRRLKYSKEFVGKNITQENGEKYKIFRHIKTSHYENKDGAILLVKFKFARLSHTMNKIISLLPMLLITGFPGFRAKMYAVNEKTGYWQGLYQWESIKALNQYKKSLILKAMTRRAINGSVEYDELNNLSLNEYIEKRIDNSDYL